MIRAACALAALTLPLAAAARAPVDRGIFSDLDAQVAIALPARAGVSSPRLQLGARGVLVLWDGDRPLAAYTLAAPAQAQAKTFGALAALLADDDRRTLGAYVNDATAVERIAPARERDADRDGIPDELDVLLGARKLVANAAKYTEGYVRLSYPGGDVPRDVGVCSDTIVRALRNAGHDLQRLVAEDIRRAPAAYPHIRRPDTNIDHRRVKNLLRWFQSHARAVPPSEAYHPGEIVFFDTFPARHGPDHVGITSDRPAPDGRPLVINNWTVGFVEKEMDLLSFVAVTHRFRLR